MYEQQWLQLRHDELIREAEQARLAWRARRSARAARRAKARAAVRSVVRWAGALMRIGAWSNPGAATVARRTR